MRTQIPTISIVIVTHNGKEVTRACLQGLQKIPRKEVIVVDNHSQDGTLAMLRRWKTFPIRVVENLENTGFAQANNQGARLATAPYIVFLNNDTIISTNFVTPLLSYLQKHKKVAAVQPVILFPDGTIDSIGSYLTPTGFLYHRAHRMIPSRKFLRSDAGVYSLKGACMLWRKSVLAEIGLLDESYFAYFEETELCHRAKNAGYTIAVCADTKITHLGGFTSNSMDQAFVQYHNIKNRFCTYIAHLSLMQLLLLLPVHYILSEMLVFKTLITHFSVAVALQKGICVGIVKGFIKRMRTSTPRQDIPLKYPDIGYYLALFSSLQGYTKIY